MMSPEEMQKMCDAMKKMAADMDAMCKKMEKAMASMKKNEKSTTMLGRM